MDIVCQQGKEPFPMSQKMKLYQIAQLAINTSNESMANGLVQRLTHKFNLSYEGIKEFLTAHGVDPVAFYELVTI